MKDRKSPEVRKSERPEDGKKEKTGRFFFASIAIGRRRAKREGPAGAKATVGVNYVAEDGFLAFLSDFPSSGLSDFNDFRISPALHIFSETAFFLCLKR